MLQSPYGAFLFARSFDHYLEIGQSGVAIPLRGFSFCKRLKAGSQGLKLSLRLQSPYGAFLFASGRRIVGEELFFQMMVAIPLRGFSFCKEYDAKTAEGLPPSLQSPYGAFLFASRTTKEGVEKGGRARVAIPLRGFSFCKSAAGW